MYGPHQIHVFDCKAGEEPVVTSHPVIGSRFRSLGALYVCTAWRFNAGYDMKLLRNAPDSAFPSRKVGETFNVSERAIDRTYWILKKGHEDYAPPVEHAPVCDCEPCVKAR